MSAFNGSGTFVISGVGLPYVTGTTISSTVANQLNTDLATGLSNCITKDGQTTPTANIPMGGFKVTGLGTATATGEALSYGATAMVTHLDVTLSQNAVSGVTVLNSNAGAAAAAGINLNNGTSVATLTQYGASATPGSVVHADGCLLQAAGAGGLTLNTSALQPLYFGVNSTLVGRFATDGSFLVGTTTAGGWSTFSSIEAKSVNGYGLSGYVSGSVGGPTAIASRVDNTAANLAQFFFSTSSVGSITTNGTITTYGTTCDYRLKTITGPLTTSGAFIDALQPKIGKWKSDGSAFVGFVAHELQIASPSSVTGIKDGEQMQTVAYASPEIIANMVAELQALRLRMAALEA